jgi:hypothetical protein
MIRYPPFNLKIDHLLGDVKRVEWSSDIVLTQYNPITNLSDPALACEFDPQNCANLMLTFQANRMQGHRYSRRQQELGLM